VRARDRCVVPIAIAILLSLPFALWASEPQRTYNKSWIWVDASNGGRPLVSGETWEVPVDYYLDPADHDRKTTLAPWGAGPWIDTPDGRYVKERGHISYPGLLASDVPHPGRAATCSASRCRRTWTWCGRTTGSS
jgi:hypothetical protein